MLFLRLKLFHCILLLLSVFLLGCAHTNTNDLLLTTTIKGEQRSESNKVRDQWRHPQQTLTFFEVKPNSTVIEVWPGKGWYTEILAPYIKQGDGQFIAAGFPINDGPKWRRKMQKAYQNSLNANPTSYNQVRVVELGPPGYWQLGEENSVDTVLTFRNVHNWLKGGYEKKMFRAFYKVLKPGGVLGVVEHRAAENADIATMKKTGYMTEALVIQLAQEAGFVLEGKSEINANPKDTKDHLKGVWTLPPTLRGKGDKTPYLAIGESDRMTLKFRKP